MVRGVEDKQTEAPRGPSQAIAGYAAHFRKNYFLFRSRRQAFCFQIILSVVLHPCVAFGTAGWWSRASEPSATLSLFNFFCVGTSPMRTHLSGPIDLFHLLTLPRCSKICFFYDHSIVRYHRSGSVCVYKLYFTVSFYLVDTENWGAGDLEFVVIVAMSNLAAINLINKSLRATICKTFPCKLKQTNT